MLQPCFALRYTGCVCRRVHMCCAYTYTSLHTCFVFALCFVKRSVGLEKVKDEGLRGAEQGLSGAVMYISFLTPRPVGSLRWCPGDISQLLMRRSSLSFLLLPPSPRLTAARLAAAIFCSRLSASLFYVSVCFFFARFVLSAAWGGGLGARPLSFA